MGWGASETGAGCREAGPKVSRRGAGLPVNRGFTAGRLKAFAMRVPTILFLAAALFATEALAEDTPAPKHKVTQSESYVAFEPVYATIVDAGRPCGMLMVHFGLDIPNEALREEATRSQPVLRDAYVRNLLSFTAAAVRPWRQPDVEVISGRLQELTDRALKKKGAHVLLAQVAMRISR